MEYDYYWGEEEKFYIEELSADLTKNIVRTINHGWDILGGHMNKEQVVIELIDADTGKAFRTDRRYVFIESTRTYPAPNKLTTDNGNVYYFDKDNKNNHLSIKVSKIEKGSDVYKTGNVIKAYYFTKKNPGDPAAVRISYMDSATGKLVRQEDKDGLIVGESYLHQPEESFKIGDVTYTYNQENAKNKLQIENLSGHPGKDEIVIYYKASAPDSNQNSDHDSKPNPPKVKKPVAPKKLQAVRTGTTNAKITFKKVKKADGYQISYADNKKFRKAKKLSTGKTTVILKKLKKNRKYYVRVRAYRKVNGVKNTEHTVKYRRLQNDHVHELVVKGEKRDEKRKKVSIYFAGIFNGNFVSPSGISTGRGGSENYSFLSVY
ncbi:MAG: fibronectin type III domain-containing protein [Lachnospiraceae bacterium]